MDLMFGHRRSRIKGKKEFGKSAERFWLGTVCNAGRWRSFVSGSFAYPHISIIGKDPRGGSRANLKEGQSVVGALKNFQKLVTSVRCI